MIILVLLIRSAVGISFFHWLMMLIEELYCQNAKCWYCMHETKKITLFSAISSLPESIDNCKWYY
jgi:uncharacterized membrane protein